MNNIELHNGKPIEIQNPDMIMTDAATRRGLGSTIPTNKNWGPVDHSGTEKHGHNHPRNEGGHASHTDVHQGKEKHSSPSESGQHNNPVIPN